MGMIKEIVERVVIVYMDVKIFGTGTLSYTKIVHGRAEQAFFNVFICYC